MAAPEGGFFIQDKLKARAPHHDSFQALWETKWKHAVSQAGGLRRFRADLFQCDVGVYPFMFGCTKDFQPVVDAIVKVGRQFLLQVIETWH